MPDGSSWEFPKVYASPYEPMWNHITPPEPLDVQVNSLYVRGSRRSFIVLPCMDYYELVHPITRKSDMDENDIGFVFAPSCNNNQELFLTESITTHNHVPHIYSVVANSVAFLNGTQVSVGNSYVFGPSDETTWGHLKDRQLHDGQTRSLITKLGSDPSVIILDVHPGGTSPYKRADSYARNPNNIRVFSISDFLSQFS